MSETNTQQNKPSFISKLFGFYPSVRDAFNDKLNWCKDKVYGADSECKPASADHPRHYVLKRRAIRIAQEEDKSPKDQEDKSKEEDKLIGGKRKRENDSAVDEPEKKQRVLKSALKKPTTEPKARSKKSVRFTLPKSESVLGKRKRDLEEEDESERPNKKLCVMPLTATPYSPPPYSPPRPHSPTSDHSSDTAPYDPADSDSCHSSDTVSYDPSDTDSYNSFGL